MSEDDRPEISLAGSTSIEGPNIWSPQPVIRLEVETSGALPFSRQTFDRLTRILSALDEKNPHKDGTTSPLNDLEDDASIGDLVASLVLELQIRSGAKTSFFASRETEPNHFEVVAEQAHPVAARAASARSIQLLGALLGNQPPDFSLALAVEREIAPTIESLTMFPSMQISVDAARQRGIPVTTSYGRPRLTEFGNGAFRQRMGLLTSSFTTPIATRLSANKRLTNQTLQMAGLPSPIGELATDEDAAVAIAGKLGYPVVVKPTRGNHGKGVFTNLQTEDQLRQAFRDLRTARQDAEIQVEQHITGNAYRITLIDGKVDCVGRNDQPRVTGDGVHTIEELIETENAQPRRALSPTNLLRPIRIDERTHDMLSRQNLTLDTVLSPGTTVLLRPVGIPGGGADFVDATDEIHPDNREIFEQTASLIGIDITGLDVVVPDIGQSMHETGGAIVEVNSGPGFDGQIYPTRGKPRNPGLAIIDMLFPGNTPGRITVIAILAEPGNQTGEHLADLLRGTCSGVGLATPETLAIDGVTMTRPGSSTSRCLFWNPEVEVAVIQLNDREISESGLPFRECDCAVVTTPIVPSTSNLRQPAAVLAESIRSGGKLVLPASQPIPTTWAFQPEIGQLSYRTSENSISITPDHGPPHAIGRDDLPEAAKLGMLDQLAPAVAAAIGFGLTLDQIRTT